MYNYNACDMHMYMWIPSEVSIPFMGMLSFCACVVKILLRKIGDNSLNCLQHKHTRQ